MTVRTAERAEVALVKGEAAPAGKAAGKGVAGKAAAGKRKRSALASTLLPLTLDIAVPVGGYYVLRDGFGVSLVMSLALTSVVPALRTIVGAVRERQFNGLAGLMVAVNVLSLALSFVTGDARLIVAKDSGITGMVGVCVLVAALRGNPLMSTGMKPFMVRGRDDRMAAWDRLTAASPRFHRLECRYSVTWGGVLIVECVARIIGAYTLSVPTMVWAGNVIIAVAVGLGIVLGGAIATQPMEFMLKAEVRAAAAGGDASPAGDQPPAAGRR